MKSTEEKPIDPSLLLFKKYRLATFDNWKELKGFQFCTPENFAEAGFYNCSSKQFPDAVKCFACKKELCGWQEEDDPFEEHVRRQNNCPYVTFKRKQVKNLTTVKDFAELCFEVKKSAIVDSFEEVRNALKNKEKQILTDLDKLKFKK